MNDLVFPGLTTKRLSISASQISDAGDLAAYYRENMSHLSPWEPSRPADSIFEDYWRQRLEIYEEDHRRAIALHLLLRYAPKAEGAVMGTVNLTQIARGPFQACYLGFGLDREAQGKGLMYEALKTTLTYAFQHLSLHRVMANYLPENHRSAKLLHRLGFMQEGYAKNYLFINGAWRDHVLTALTNPNPTPPINTG